MDLVTQIAQRVILKSRMLLLFTDLDGTLLDEHTYSFADAAPALEGIRRRGIPLLLVTSKTRAEVEVIRRALGNTDPFIVENGGGIYLPASATDLWEAAPQSEPRDGYRLIPLGARYTELTAALDAASRESGVPTRGFHQMTAPEVADRAGLPLPDAERACQREFGEPFVLEEGAHPEPLIQALERRGFSVTRGGRFYHVLRGNDKGKAVEIVTGLYRRNQPLLRTAGLGDSANDLPFLERMDHPILIPSPRLPDMKTRLPRAYIAPEPGPSGWNLAVLELLQRWS